MVSSTRRSFLTATLGFGALGVLAACGAATPTAAAEPTKPAPAAGPAKPTGPITMTVHVNSAVKEEGMTKPGEGRFGSWYERMQYEEHAPKYTEKNPNVKVVIDWWVDTGPAKILATKAAGQLGDLVHSLRVPFDVMARNELIRPIDDLVKGNNLD